MNQPKLSRRQLKKKIIEALEKADFSEALQDLRALPLSTTINGLLGTLLHPQPEVRWLGITACGILIGDLARIDMESARRSIRRQLWNLTEESGGCAIGAPELIAEALANDENLAREFSPSFTSHIMPEGNYLDFIPLQTGVVWGLGRLAKTYPEFLKSSVSYLEPLLESEDKAIRGMSAYAIGLIQPDFNSSQLEAIVKDESKIQIFLNLKLTEISIHDLCLQPTPELKVN